MMRLVIGGGGGGGHGHDCGRERGWAWGWGGIGIVDSYEHMSRHMLAVLTPSTTAATTGDGQALWYSLSDLAAKNPIWTLKRTVQPQPAPTDSVKIVAFGDMGNAGRGETRGLSIANFHLGVTF